MEREPFIYKCEETTCKGVLVHNEIVKEPRPAIIVAHAWRGLDDFAIEKAEALARLGFVALAADIYGDGKRVENDEEAAELMLPLFIDRSLLRKRITAAYEALKKHELVDSKNIGAIGFCFGGLTVIELLRSGANVRGVASFHGVLGDKMGGVVADREPNAEKLRGALLLLHGHDDPLVTTEDIVAIQKEFSEAKVDWQMVTYGHAAHAFTNPKVKDRDSGFAFDRHANDRSWLAMKNFFHEIF